ncbi:MAG: cyclic-di-AMP receptor [Oscillospiraceae bacterium]|nr:cyclic-di-AMP receptor [Oscillospiraceae bacterium]
MKLIIAIVNNEDSSVVASALTKEKFTVTRLATNGGFLMVGNTTFLIGVEDDKVEFAKSIINKYSQTRTHTVPSTGAFGMNMRPDEPTAPRDVSVGGATVFVMGVESMDKY